ncbi:hypothetical protein FS842_006829 [Serendipita sp. 407]|nr:hypothetical protein FS842_006829 [Serendipita sp. 407]
MMTSPGQWGYATEESIREREPTDKDMMFITKSEAKKRWVNQVWEVEGHTWLYNDPNQFLGHFYHFVAESLVGFWAMHAGTLDSLITARGETTAPLPSRAIFLRCTPSDIRDSSHFNSYYMHAAFPSISLETSANWDDRVFMTRRGDKVFKFSYALLGDRSASFRGRICGSQNQRIAAEARRVVEDRTTRWWWEPIRRAVLRHANVPEDIVDMPVTSVASFDTGIELSEPKKAFPIVITYINRQGGRRCLRGEDHEVLVRELSQLVQRRGWEFHDVKAQRLTQEEQLTMAARTTVLVGVHGNGLSHLLSMAPTQLSTVIEIFGLGGFMHDYEWTARELGHKYYGIHNDTTFEHPNLPEVAVPESFQSSSIPVQGSLVARLIEKRLDEFMSLLG